jgi:hypothetical protein
VKLKDLEKRLKQEPDNFSLRVQIAGLMREAGRSVEAVELYRSVALAYRDQGRTQQAIAVCRSILDIAPDDAACQGLLAMLQGRGTPSRPPVSSTSTPAGRPLAQPVEPAPREPIVVRPSPLPPEKVPNVPSLRPATKPPSRTPTKPPQSEPMRRSSFDETPLPRPIPYHVSDPTSKQLDKISQGDLDLPASEGADTRPGEERRRSPSGLAQAARRISGLISDSRVPQELDLAAELDTRQRRLMTEEELAKIEQPPPTIPVDRIVDEDDLPTPPPRDIDILVDDLSTDRVDSLTPPPRGSGSDDMLTPPPRGSEDAITPPPLTGTMPAKTQRLPPPPRPSRPPPIVAIPPKRSGPTPLGSPVAKPPPIPPLPPSRPAIPPSRPAMPPSRPAMPRIPRDSDEELTKPRDFEIIDEDDE